MSAKFQRKLSVQVMPCVENSNTYKKANTVDTAHYEPAVFANSAIVVFGTLRVS